MLLSDYCSEVNTRGIKKRKKAKQTNEAIQTIRLTGFTQAAFHEDYAELNLKFTRLCCH